MRFSVDIFVFLALIRYTSVTVTGSLLTFLFKELKTEWLDEKNGRLPSSDLGFWDVNNLHIRAMCQIFSASGFNLIKNKTNIDEVIISRKLKTVPHPSINNI